MIFCLSYDRIQYLSYSIISDDFVGGLLNKQPVGASADGPPFSANTSSSSKAYTGPTSSGARSGVWKADEESTFTGQQLSSAKELLFAISTSCQLSTNSTNLIFADTRQQMFTEGLTSFFSDFVQSSAVVAVDETKAPKSAVKAKKTEKRKANVL